MLLAAPPFATYTGLPLAPGVPGYPAHAWPLTVRSASAASVIGMLKNLFISLSSQTTH